MAGDTNGQSDVFTRAAATPVVESIAPATGPPGGATFVTISGSGFLPNATVAVGSADVVANGVNVVDANTITAMFGVALAAPLGSLTVLVTNPRRALEFHAHRRGGHVHRVLHGRVIEMRVIEMSDARRVVAVCAPSSPLRPLPIRIARS